MDFATPMDCTVHEILQAMIMEWVAFPFSRGSSQPKDQTQVYTFQEDSMLYLASASCILVGSLVSLRSWDPCVPSTTASTSYSM